MKINSAQEVNKKLNEIWSEKLRDPSISDLLAPCYFSENITHDDCKFLVVGINPSFSLKGWKEILQNMTNLTEGRLTPKNQQLVNHARNNSLDERLLIRHFLFDPQKSKAEDFQNLEEQAFRGHDYFKKMHELTHHVFGDETLLHHHDMFFYRETKQSNLKKLIKSHPSFFKKQKQLSYEILNWLKPEIILVANAYAGTILKDLIAENSGKLIFNETTGTYKIIWNENKSAHIFFSGMLSGQRALDLGSYERLKWHMKAIKEGKSMKE